MSKQSLCFGSSCARAASTEVGKGFFGLETRLHGRDGPTLPEDTQC